MAAQFALISLFWIIKIWSVTCSSAVVVVSNVALSNSPVFENLNLGEWGHFQFDDGNLEFEMECPLSIAVSIACNIIYQLSLIVNCHSFIPILLLALR